jgi:hypothetical protein
VEANYQFMLRLCHVWDRLLLRTAVRGRGEFRVTSGGSAAGEPFSRLPRGDSGLTKKGKP